ncbi:PDR/VanB family oxidoreductase [Hydrogenophaga sp. ANAO-22]|uniref:PDR/VanB family oxidoreductase n=1 Tax=Hydrogenophaga sp. ANAO-22 TaxID=3166645 RepID=UPI0036D4051B
MSALIAAERQAPARQGLEIIRVRVRSARRVALDVRELTLEALDGGELPAYTPGAHIDLHLKPGLVRQYSLCGDGGDRASYTVAVKLEAASRGGSRFLHEAVAIGTVLDIGTPRNHFPLLTDAAHSVLVAGGIGITPLLSMARHLQAGGKPFELLHFVRAAEHAAYRELLASDPFSAHCRLWCGLPPEAVREQLERALSRPPAGAHLYLCGPAGFMDTVLAVAARHWPPGQVHLEHFAAPTTASEAADSAFEVRLARGARTVTVPAHMTIVDALREQGVAVETACEQGICGTCVTPVLEGEVDHRDGFLTDTEKAQGDCIALCVSRARGPFLTLDL